MIKKILLFACILFLFISSVFAVDYTVGSGGNYSNLTDCLNFINNTANTCDIISSGDYPIGPYSYQLYDDGIRVSVTDVSILCDQTEIIGNVTDVKNGIEGPNDNLVIDGCRLLDWYRCINVYTGHPNNVTIRNNYLSYRNTGIYARTDNSIYENNYFTDGTVADAQSRGIYPNDYNVTIRNNHFNNSYWGMYCWISYDGVFSGNNFTNLDGGIGLVSLCIRNNITENIFYNSDISIYDFIGLSSSYDNIVWKNHFLDTNGVSDNNLVNIYCHNGEGNFYDESATPITGDCGPGILNNVTPVGPNAERTVSWSSQSAISTVTYDVFLNHLGGTTQIGSTTSTSLNYDFSSYINQSINISIIPWIDGSRYNGTHIEGDSFIISIETPPRNISDYCEETQTLVFLGFSLLALLVVVGGAFAIVMMLKGNVDAIALIIMIAGFIGLTVVLFVGYIAIAYVGQSVC